MRLSVSQIRHELFWDGKFKGIDQPIGTFIKVSKVEKLNVMMIDRKAYFYLANKYF